MILKVISDFFSGLKSYSEEVTPIFRPLSIVPASWYNSCKPWKGIVIHHSLSKDGSTNDWAGIRKYHMSFRIDGEIVNEQTFNQRQLLGSGKVFEKPWLDIGYHGGWELDNGTYIFKIGRPWNMAGAHAGFKDNNSYNDTYLGLCAVGNYDLSTPPQELWNLCLSTVREIKQHFGFGIDKILGHREVYDKVGIPRQKTCPGSLFDIDKFRREI